jgi:peptidoglycan/LPS O-acetylase OafA/YrhL
MNLPADGAVGKVYLPGLNGVRFIAASMVLIHHTEQGKSTVGLDNWFSPGHPFVHHGDLGVTLFFVLSGFLISYLLLTELGATGTVNVRHFYIRRILRIWPLYYFIVLLAWVLLPGFALFDFPMFRSPFGPEYLPRIAFFLLLCPQLAFPRFVTPTPAGPLWSVGVEEQFYAFWPWLVRWCKGRILWPCLSVIALMIAARVAARYSWRLWRDTPWAEWAIYLRNVLDWSRFGCMAIGGIAAWLSLRARDRLGWLFRRDVQSGVIALTLYCLIQGVSNRFLEHELYSVLFGVLILNIALNPRSLIRLENRLLNFLGEISYGLYVYHWFMIVLVLNLLKRMGGIESSILRNFFIYGGVAGLTIAVASLSHRLLERRFLKMKNSFAVILSGSAAKPAPNRCPSEVHTLD